MCQDDPPDAELELLPDSAFEPLYDSLFAALEAANGSFREALISMRLEVEVNGNGNITKISDPMMNGRLDDKEFALLRQIPTLKDIWLREIEMTDRGLGALEGMPHLTRLSLEAANITDKGLEHLRHLKELETLHIGRSKVTGSGLVHVPNPDGIRDLGFDHSPFNDTGLNLLARFPNLEKLSLWGSEITDDGIVFLKTCPALRYVDLTETAITDRGIDNLVHMPALERLELRETGATDASLSALLKMPRLKHASFGVHQISLATFERLQEAGIEVEHGGLLNVRRETNLLRYLAMDFEVNVEKSSLQAFISAGEPGIAYRLEIECTDRYVPAYMQPAYLIGPPMRSEKNWRQLVGQQFVINFQDDDLHPILPDNPCNIYVGWHAVPNNHRIQFKNRRVNHFLVDWRCEAMESADGGREPVWVNAEIPFTKLTVTGDETLTLADAKRLATRYFDLADFFEPRLQTEGPGSRVHFAVRPVDEQLSRVPFHGANIR
jgi:hypothetical protein